MDRYRSKVARLFAGQRLFLKIFLWFWLTVAGLMGWLALGHIYGFNLNGIRIVKPPNMNATIAAILAPAIVQAYETGGPAGFSRFIQNSAFENERKLYLLDGYYNDVLSRPVSEDALQLAHVARAGQLTLFWGHIAAYRCISPLGKPYILIVYIQGKASMLEQIVEEEGVWFVLGVILLVTALCFWLAHHIVSPMLEIQHVAKRVSEGDLQARASSALLTRHDELAALASDFNMMVEQIEALLQTHKHLLASVSHEVRSPLTRLTIAVALLRRTNAAGIEPLLARIDREIVNMDVLMGQLLTLARLESGVERVAGAPVALGPLLEEIADDANFELEPLGKAAWVNLRCDAVLHDADATALRSALENIIRNAGRFAPVSSDVEILLDSRKGGAHPSAVIVIRDNGPGVREEHLESIFQPFFRGQSEAAADGNGLGLAIAAEAIRLHGGSVVARNRPTGGLEVEVTLPLDRVRSSAAEPALAF